MSDASGGAARVEIAIDLPMAPGIAGRDDSRTSRADVTNLSLEQCISLRRLRQRR